MIINPTLALSNSTTNPNPSEGNGSVRGVSRTENSENLDEEPPELEEADIHVEVDLSSMFGEIESDEESRSGPGRVATAEEITAAGANSLSNSWRGCPCSFAFICKLQKTHSCWAVGKIHAEQH